jgi:predicted nucleotidyltransferase component of viral defense system
MTVLYDPKEKGFSEALTSIDRAQVAMLRELASAADGRLILKGGLAMRACIGSMRLTKDVDFDLGASISTAAASASVQRGLRAAAQAARILSPAIDVTKETDTTVRVRLSGHISAGVPIRFVVEVSGRNTITPDMTKRETVSPPASYGIAPFVVSTYTHDMLAASKVLAAMSENRSVPRDIYDLNDLLGADPASLLRSMVGKEYLLEIKERALQKLGLIKFEQAVNELMPYIPREERESLNQDVWQEITLRVADQIEAWAISAMQEAPPRDAHR